MTNEEALRWTDDSLSQGKVLPEQESYAYMGVVKIALEKQIPHKPVGRHTDYRCSVCGTRVRSGRGSSSRTKDTVCRKCFTVIDWSETT